MRKVQLLFLIGILAFKSFSQTTLVNKSVVSPYLDEWISNNDFIILNNSINGPVRIYTTIYDSSSNVVLGTSNYLFDDLYDTLSLNDTLFSADIFSIYRVYLDSPYSITFDSLLYLPFGSYSIKVCFKDTNGVVIDSSLGSFYIDSLIGPALVSPKDNRDINYSLTNNLQFKFLNRDVLSTVYYEYLLKEVPISFELGSQPLESILLDTAIADKVRFNIIGEDTSVSFAEYGVIATLDTNKLYVWAIRQFKDASRYYPITANNGLSTPFLLRVTSRAGATLADANAEAINCESPSRGFEDGSLNGWLCGTGRKIKKLGGNAHNRQDGIIIETTGSAVADRHTIVSTGIDPWVGLLTKVPAGGGSFALKLGNDDENAEAESVSTTFTVNSNNAVIRLRYALVLQDPEDHVADEKPLFRARVFRKRKFLGITSFSNVIEPIIRVSDKNDPYFTSLNATLVYSQWNCVEIDLRRFIGETVTLELATADCSIGEHFGYAYIDFCGNLNGNPSLAVNASYCQGAPVIADGSASTNLTSWLFTVEECTNSAGTRFGAPEYITDWFYGVSVQNDFDITDFLGAKGVLLGCGKYYRIKLAGNNFCSGWVENVKVIYINCPASNLAGPDRCVSGTNSVQLGSNPIAGYTYAWNPASCLTSGTVANPTFNKTLCPPQTYPLKYTLTTTFLGCSSTDDVYIYNSPPTIGTITSIAGSGVCEDRTYSTSITGGNNENLKWSYTVNGVTTNYYGNPIKIPLLDVSVTINISLTNACGTATTSISQPARSLTNFYGPLPTLIVPLALDPQFPDKRSMWIWEYGKNKGQSPAYGIVGYHLLVYNRWGQIVFDKTEERSTSWSNGDIVWDGKYNGQPVQSGVYVWKMSMWNCDNPKTDKHAIIRWGCPGGYKFKRVWWPVPHKEWYCPTETWWIDPNGFKEDITVVNFSY